MDPLGITQQFCHAGCAHFDLFLNSSLTICLWRLMDDFSVNIKLQSIMGNAVNTFISLGIDLSKLVQMEIGSSCPLQSQFGCYGQIHHFSFALVLINLPNFVSLCMSSLMHSKHMVLWLQYWAVQQAPSLLRQHYRQHNINPRSQSVAPHGREWCM